MDAVRAFCVEHADALRRAVQSLKAAEADGSQSFSAVANAADSVVDATPGAAAATAGWSTGGTELG